MELTIETDSIKILQKEHQSAVETGPFSDRTRNLILFVLLLKERDLIPRAKNYVKLLSQQGCNKIITLFESFMIRIMVCKLAGISHRSNYRNNIGLEFRTYQCSLFTRKRVKELFQQSKGPRLQSNSHNYYMLEKPVYSIYSAYFFTLK